MDSRNFIEYKETKKKERNYGKIGERAKEENKSEKFSILGGNYPVCGKRCFGK